MKHPNLAIAAIAIALALSGCSAVSTGAAAPSASATKTPTTTPTPTPTVMPVEEAGTYYLTVVCPANKASQATSDAFTAQDLASIQANAAAARDAYQQQVKMFTDPMKLWPQQVNDDIKKLVDSDYTTIADYDSLSRVGSIEAANSVLFASNDEAGAAAQRVRIALGLSADTSVGC